MRLADRVVWITGASTGIGKALALALADAGARLILSARNRERLDAVRAATAHPARVHVLALDVADHDALPARAEQALGLEGRVDVLVHNAGVGQRSPAADTELHVTRRILDVNFLGPVALTRAVLPSMRARQNGHLVVVSSVLGTFGAKRRSSYAASKHALHGFFDSLRAELADEGIRVTLICPGYIRTPISEQALTADGTPHGRADPGQASGMDPARCAARMVRAIEREQREVVIGGWETAGVWLKRWCPWLLARILRRMRMD